jgi:RNA polymerase sigma factor (sigma-70 family)
MNADIKTISGGEGKILPFITHIVAQHDTDDTVNELIMECSRSKESLSKLYIMFKDNVFAVAFGITCDYQLAEDCVIETFVRLPQVKRFSPKKGNGKGFILTIARNVALELRRKYRREISEEIIQSYGEADKTVEDSIYINQLLKNLNDKQRQTVVLRSCAELTFKEIAKIMKCPETTVKSRYRKAMSILQEKAGDDR